MSSYKTNGSSTNSSNTNHICFLRLDVREWCSLVWEGDWCLVAGRRKVLGGRKWCWWEQARTWETSHICNFKLCKIGGIFFLYIMYQINSLSAFSKFCHTNRFIFMSRFFYILWFINNLANVFLKVVSFSENLICVQLLHVCLAAHGKVTQPQTKSATNYILTWSQWLLHISYLVHFSKEAIKNLPNFQSFNMWILRERV